jgi:Uri superfamily endonuclease
LAGAYGAPAMAKAHYLLKEGMYDYVGSDMHGLNNYERFLPEIRLSKKNMTELERLLENNKKLFG